MLQKMDTNDGTERNVIEDEYLDISANEIPASDDSAVANENPVDDASASSNNAQDCAICCVTFDDDTSFVSHFKTRKHWFFFAAQVRKEKRNIRFNDKDKRFQPNNEPLDVDEFIKRGKCNLCSIKRHFRNKEDVMYHKLEKKHFDKLLEQKKWQPFEIDGQMVDIDIEVVEDSLKENEDYTSRLQKYEAKKKVKHDGFVSIKNGCTLCDMKLNGNSYVDLYKHVQTEGHQKLRSEVPENEHQCKECRVSFTEKDLYNTHIKSHGHWAKIARLGVIAKRKGADPTNQQAEIEELMDDEYISREGCTLCSFAKVITNNEELVFHKLHRDHFVKLVKLGNWTPFEIAGQLVDIDLETAVKKFEAQDSSHCGSCVKAFESESDSIVHYKSLNHWKRVANGHMTRKNKLPKDPITQETALEDLDEDEYVTREGCSLCNQKQVFHNNESVKAHKLLKKHFMKVLELDAWEPFELGGKLVDIDVDQFKKSLTEEDITKVAEKDEAKLNVLRDGFVSRYHGCSVCSDYKVNYGNASYISLNQHVKSKKHQFRVLGVKGKEDLKDLSVDQLYKKMAERDEAQFQEDIDNDEHVTLEGCSLCRVMFGVSFNLKHNLKLRNAWPHMASKKHNDKLRLVLSKQGQSAGNETKFNENDHSETNGNNNVGKEVASVQYPDEIQLSRFPLIEYEEGCEFYLIGAKREAVGIYGSNDAKKNKPNV